MDFKRLPMKFIVPLSVLGLLVIGLMIARSAPKADISEMENNEPQSPIAGESAKENVVPAPEPPSNIQDDAAIQEQLDRDRQQQKQTKDLKIKLEQTDLELEQEKALAQINKLKKDNSGAFNDPSVEGTGNLPEIKVVYIGGDGAKKEAIISIGGTNYQVKNKTSPTDNIQVTAISDSSVTLHFSAPQELTKTIDYKPE